MRINTDAITAGVERTLRGVLKDVEGGAEFMAAGAVAVAEVLEAISAGPVDVPLAMSHAEQRLRDLAAAQLDHMDTQARERVRDLLITVGRGLVAGALAMV